MSDELRGVFDNEVIRASAGTGKTFELSNRFLRLLASGVDCETILATTFTRKGAGEILDRIVQRLAQAALDESAAEILATQLEWKLDQARIQDLLRELIENLHRLQIGTLDAFFYRIAQAFRLELQLPTQWQIANEQQIATLQTNIIHEILHDKDVVTLLHLMTHGEAQRKIADLIQMTVDELYEIFVQSHRDDWHRLEMPSNFSFDKNFDSLLEKLSTIKFPHKKQASRVDEDIELIRQREFLELAETPVYLSVLDGRNSYYKALPDECIGLYKEMIEHCRGIVIDMLIRKNRSTFDLLQKFSERFEDEKTHTGQLRFQDVNTRLEAFIKDKQTDDFAFRLDHNINHLLLDEFQDTSISQWNVITPFAQRTTEDDSRKSFFCVGDLKQAIFGWRDGVAEIFDTVENNLSNMASPRNLVKSFRSSRVIIESVNNVFQNIDRYQPKKPVVQEAIDSFSQSFDPQQTARTDLPGYFSVEFAGDSDERGRHKKNRARNDNVYFSTVEKIRLLQKTNPGRTIGVLVRKNETVGELIYMLRDAGIAASEEGGNLLTDSVAIEKLLALLTLADHPDDSIARFTVSHGPLAEELNLHPETQSNQKENMAAAYRASEKIRRELIQSGYGVTVESYASLLAPSCTARELSRLQQLVQEAFNYEKAMDQTRVKLRPSKFVEYIRTEFKASDASSAMVRVMTIHQSKGLEFDIVVLPMLYAQNGWFSHPSRVVVGREHPTAPINLVCRLANKSYRKLLPGEFQEAFDESERREVRDEICLLYVAMTRAIHASHFIMSYGIKPDQHASGAIVLSTLYPGERKEGIVYELGDPDWHAQMIAEKKRDSSSITCDEYYLPPSAKISRSRLVEEIRTGRGMTRVSPSSLEGGNEIRMGSIFETLSRTQQLDQGTFVHACFEKLVWLDEEKPTQSKLSKHIESLGPLEVDVTELFDLFFQSIEQPNFEQLLTQETYLEKSSQQIRTDSSLRLEVQNERAFSVLDDNHLLQGVIDRLVLIYADNQLVGADVIDFKTDVISGGQLNDRVEHYRPQLEAYRKAIAKLFKLPIEDIGIRLAFVRSDTVINLCDKSSASNDENESFKEESTKGQNAENPQPAKPKFMKNKQLRLWCDDES